MSTSNLLDLVRTADPLAGDEADRARTDQHLQSARRVLMARTAGAAQAPARAPLSGRRRLAVVLAGATALSAAAVVVPGLVDRPQLSGSLVGTATASEGGLVCGEGYAQAIRPDTARSRPWPSALPAGWQVSEVFARSTEVTGWCTTPSLTAAQLDAGGLVTGTVQITGPTPGIRISASERVIEERIGAYDARRLQGESELDAGAAPHSAWVITDGTGAQWFAAVDGYPLDQARRMLAAATLDGRTVTWDSTATPELRVLHQRTGEPYPTSSTGEDWYVNVDGPGSAAGSSDAEAALQRGFSATSGYGDAGTVLSHVSLGSRLTTVAGRPALVLEDDGAPIAVYADLGQGVRVQSSVNGDLPEVLQMLASLENLPADDPRLDDLALEESYEDKRK
jgi:hypothetical protein